MHLCVYVYFYIYIHLCMGFGSFQSGLPVGELNTTYESYDLTKVH